MVCTSCAILNLGQESVDSKLYTKLYTVDPLGLEYCSFCCILGGKVGHVRFFGQALPGLLSALEAAAMS